MNQYQKILQETSTRLQLLNEQLGQLNADMIDTELIRQSNLNDWKKLNSHNDNEGRFIVEF